MPSCRQSRWWLPHRPTNASFSASVEHPSCLEMDRPVAGRALDRLGGGVTRLFSYQAAGHVLDGRLRIQLVGRARPVAGSYRHAAGPAFCSKGARLRALRRAAIAGTVRAPHCRCRRLTLAPSNSGKVWPNGEAALPSSNDLDFRVNGPRSGRRRREGFRPSRSRPTPSRGSPRRYRRSRPCGRPDAGRRAAHMNRWGASAS